MHVLVIMLQKRFMATKVKINQKMFKFWNATSENLKIRKLSVALTTLNF